MLFYGQPAFLSIVCGILAVLLYHFFAPAPPSPPSSPDSASADDSSPTPLFGHINTKMYLGVFLVVAVLVYGSFVVAESVGTCRFIDEQPDIQTGGRPPF